MMMFVTSELTTSPNAFPMTTAMARSIMLPLKANSLNSCQRLLAFMVESPVMQFNRDRVPRCCDVSRTWPDFACNGLCRHTCQSVYNNVEGNEKLRRETTAMTNREIATWLADYADLLEKGGEKLYRTKAYRRAAESVLFALRPVERIVREEGRKGLQKQLP